ncbi:hypothetical protein CHU98_g2308 [Xylaria longipes]|nr:hypothetical protein CHU98_g2308 [Xylaria longipes]
MFLVITHMCMQERAVVAPSQERAVAVPNQPGPREATRHRSQPRHSLRRPVRNLIVVGAAATVAWTLYRAGLGWADILDLASAMGTRGRLLVGAVDDPRYLGVIKALIDAY